MADFSVLGDTKLDNTGIKTSLSAVEEAASLVGKIISVKVIGSLIKMGTTYNAQMEQYQASFETMLGDAQRAATLLDTLKNIASVTPFDTAQLADTAQLLINYGISADEVIGSINMLGDISQGNAVKLQSIALAYGQMSSLGKVTMQDMKQMINAGFNPLQAIAAMTGETLQQVTQRYEAGEIAVSEVTAAMQYATSEGGKYYQSMETQSRTLSGRWSTLKDDGMALLGSAMEPLSNFLRDKLLPDLTAMIGEIDSAKLQNRIQKLLDTVVGLVPVLKSGLAAVLAFSAVTKIGATVNKLSVSYAAAALQVKSFSLGQTKAAITSGVLTGALKAQEIVVALLEGKITLATAAKAFWNTVCKADPTVLVVAGIVALTTALIAYVATQKQAERQELTLAKTRRDALAEATASYSELKAACDEQAASDMAGIANTQRLYAELQSLADANGEVAEGDRTRAAFLADQLSAALGIEISLVDGQIENYGELKVAVEEAIAAKKAEILLSAYEAEYAEALKNRSKALAQAAADQRALEETEAAVTELRKAHATELMMLQDEAFMSSAEGAEYAAQVTANSWYTELAAQEEVLAQQQENFGASSELLNGYMADVAGYEAASAEALQGNYDKAAEILDKQGQAFITAKDVACKSAEEHKQTLGQQYADSLDALALYAEKYAAGTAGFNAAGLAELQKAAADSKTEAEKVGANIVDGQIIGIDGKKIDLTTTLEGLTESSVKLCKDSRPEFQSAGADMGQGIIDGIIVKSEAIKAAAQRVVLDAIDAARKAADSHSPSKKMIALGEDMGEGSAIGLEHKTARVKEASAKLIDAAIPEKMFSLGTDYAGSASRIAQTAAAALGAIIPRVAGAGSSVTNSSTMNNYFGSNIQTPDEIARALRIQQKFGLAGAK